MNINKKKTIEILCDRIKELLFSVPAKDLSRIYSVIYDALEFNGLLETEKTMDFTDLKRRIDLHD